MKKGEIINLHVSRRLTVLFLIIMLGMIMMCRAVSIIIRVWWTEFLAAGWKFNFVRMHLDPYWSDDPTMQFCNGMRDTSASPKLVSGSILMNCLYRWRKHGFMSKGMYVVMRPPGVCPNEAPIRIELETYQQSFLFQSMGYCFATSKLKNNTV